VKSNPSLYQIDARSWLYRCSQAAGHRLHLDEVPESDLDRLADHGFDWIWLLGVWQTGPAGAAVSRKMADRWHFRESLPDLSGTSVFIGAGRNDPMVRVEEVERLAEILRDAGAATAF